MVYMSIQFNDDAIRKLGAQVAGDVGRNSNQVSMISRPSGWASQRRRLCKP